MYVNVGEED